MNDELRDTDESVVDEQTTSITEDTAIDTCAAESLVNESEDAKGEVILSEPPTPEAPVDEEGNALAIFDPTKVNLTELSTE